MQFGKNNVSQEPAACTSIFIAEMYFTSQKNTILIISIFYTSYSIEVILKCLLVMMCIFVDGYQYFWAACHLQRTQPSTIWSGYSSTHRPPAMMKPSRSYGRDIITNLDDSKITVFSKRLQIRKQNCLKTARKLMMLPLATLTLTYQLRMALRSLPNENGVPYAKAWPTTSPDFTPWDFQL
jgi:hypothetical protein